ncbi:hypothetical protein [Duganella sp. Root1480D1]|uniref:hypothetical protein n=1 Tax=Duganella sp. Root1480D1 TaxID=1736471 RepID=UPI0007103013|nr:hypothetical protein [Duganella sp. Root1480D1]KQZ43319.1 hypothetical protein ASD58_21810 [Duganella sp. Root1480D1]
MSNDRNFQLSEMRFIKRIVVGNDNPQHMRTEAEVEESMALVNKCLQGTPRGYLLSIDKSFGLYNIGEHQVVLQYAVYNVGFSRKPMFLD